MHYQKGESASQWLFEQFGIDTQLELGTWNTVFFGLIERLSATQLLFKACIESDDQ